MCQVSRIELAIGSCDYLFLMLGLGLVHRDVRILYEVGFLFCPERPSAIEEECYNSNTQGKGRYANTNSYLCAS